MEILVAILIIFLLMGLLLVGIRHVRKLGKGAGDRAVATALNIAVTQFRTEFGFLPPLVKDYDTVQSPAGPIAQLSSGKKVPKVYSASVTADATFLRTSTPPLAEGLPQPIVDVRFSVYSLPYYCIGGLEVMESASVPPTPIDGVAGPGFLTPKRDGSFERAGRRFESFFDLSKNGKALFSPDAAAGRVVVRDAQEVPVRYYRWLRGNVSNGQVNKPDDCNVPILLGRASESPDLRSAEYAIVCAGPDGVFGDEADIKDLLTGPIQAAYGMTWSDLASKVGLPTPDTNDLNALQRVRDTARKDNIIYVGAAK